MNLETLGKLLLDISNLSRDQKAIIFIELAKDFGFSIDGKKANPSLPAEATSAVAFDLVASMNRQKYGPSNKAVLDDAAYHWPRQSRNEQDKAVSSIARRFGRTEKAIRYQITSRLK